MPAKLENGLSASRVVFVYGVGDVVFHFDESGITAHAAGCKTGVSTTWGQLVNIMNTPSDVPAHLEGRPMDFLKQQLSKAGRKKNLRSK